MRNKKIYFLILAVGIFIFLTFSSSYFFLFTTKGSASITKSVLSKYAKPRDIGIKRIDGTILRGMSFQDVSIKNLREMPQGTAFEIKKIDLYLNPLNVKTVDIKIHNARLILPTSEPIFFHGTYKALSLDFNIYAKSIDLGGILEGITKNNISKDLSGEVNNLDIYLKGPFLEPELRGELQIEKFSRHGISLADCPASFILKFKDIKNKFKIYGEVFLNSGVVSRPKSAVVNLKKSKVLFNGRPDRPSFDLRGTSVVEGTKIDIALRGTIDNPRLKLSSEPAMPEEQLLLMLATNKSWKGTERAFAQKQLSPDIVTDFIDYFVLAGSGSRIAQHFGISDVLLKYDDETKGIGIKKAISDKVEASYAVEQPQTKEKKPPTTHKVGGEYKITESVSIEGQKELKQEDKTKEKEQEKTPTDDKVLLKYKKQF